MPDSIYFKNDTAGESQSNDTVTRFLDIVLSLVLLVLLAPLFVVIALLIKCSSKGPVIFRQIRVGKDEQDFVLYKFRTMYTDVPSRHVITVGERDRRITAVGYRLRKLKLDELPQLYNVLKGEMSFVGPRPELRRFTELYSPEQRAVLSVRPGITDTASIYFRNENALLAQQAEPEEFYIREIMPVKIQLNRQWLSKRSVCNYFLIIFRTILSMFREQKPRYEGQSYIP